MNLKINKHIRYRGDYLKRKKAIASIAVAGVIGITIHVFGIVDYIEAEFVNLVTLQDEIKYEEIRNVEVLEVDNLDSDSNDLYLVQMHQGITKVKYYDLETNKKLIEFDNDGIFSYDSIYKEVNGRIVNMESFYKYINAVDTLKENYTKSEFLEIWEKTKEHYENMKRIDREEEKKKEYYKYGFIFY